MASHASIAVACLLLLVAGVTVVACIPVVVAGIPDVAGIPLVPECSHYCWPSCSCDVPGVVGVPCVDGVPTVAFVPAVAGDPADPGVPILAGVFTDWAVQWTLRHIRLSDYGYRTVIFSCYRSVGLPNTYKTEEFYKLSD